MGLLDIFRNAKKQPTEQPNKQAERLEKKVIRQQMYRFNQELKDWKIGINNFEDPFNPVAVDLIRVYNDIIIDAHLSASIDSRIIRTTSKDFKVVNEKGEELKDETEVFTSPWFRDFLRYSLESKFFGYSLIQFGDLKGKRFKSVELIPREYVYAQKNAVRLTPYSSNDLAYFDEAPYDAWVLGVGKPTDLGLLMKAAPLIIYKKTAIGSWTEFAELFGAPFRLGKTNIRDKELRDNMFDMLENMGRNAFGVFDESDSLEFIRDGKTDSHNVYNQLIERVNSEVSKLILGSTMTMDAGSSRSQSEVHERTSAAINKEDAFFITSLVNDELIPFLNKYHGFNITGAFIFDDTENTTKAEQFKIDSELIKLGFNVPKQYLTDTYGTPIDEKEEEDETPEGPKGPKGEKEEKDEDSAEGDELENSIKKKTTLASIYEAFTSTSSDHVCNVLDYEETPLPEWSDDYVEEIIAGVYSGLYTIDKLPESLYNEIGSRLMQGLYDGLATGEALSTIKDPGYIKTLQKNIFTFSGAKTWHEVKLMSDYLIDEKGNARSFKEYKDFAKNVFGEFNVNYLKTEINHAKGSAQMADKWQQFGEEAELFPYLRYVTAGDGRVRPAHKALNGIIKRYDSPFWKENAPLNGWNCRCDLKQVEEAIETPDDVIAARIEKETDGKGLETPDYMKNNPGVEVFGKEHPYFKIPRAFKEEQKKNFGLPEPPKLSDEKIVKEIKKAQKEYEDKKISLPGFVGEWHHGKLTGKLLDVQKAVEKTVGFKVPDDLIKLVPEDLKVKEFSNKGAHYTPSTKEIFFDEKGYRSLRNDYYKYSVTSHELGHAIHRNTKQVYDNSMYSVEFGKIIAVMEKELKDIGKKQLNKSFVGSGASYLEDVLIKNYDEALTNKNTALQEKLGSVADSIQGLTKGRFCWGHEKAYQKDRGFNEIFAHLSENYFVGNDEFEKYLPNTYKAGNEYLKELFK